MTIHYTEEFDNQLKELDIYQRYPVLMPFIGNKYKGAPVKVIFIAESHYMPNNLGGELREEWYKNDEKWLDEQLKRFASEGRFNEIEDVNGDWEKAKIWLNTRCLTNGDANKTIDNGKPIYKKPLEIFTKVFSEKLNISNYKESFPYIVFYNYFQRPSETNRTIQSDADGDYQWGYKVLVKLVSILKPDKIVFISDHAKRYGFEWAGKNGYNPDDEIGAERIIPLRHPSGQGGRHWNRSRDEYGGKSSPQYLEEKLRELL